MNKVIVHTQDIGVVMDESKVILHTGVSLGEIQCELRRGRPLLESFKMQLSKVHSSNSLVTFKDVPTGVLVEVGSYQYLVVAYDNNIYCNDDQTIYYDHLIAPLLNGGQYPEFTRIRIDNHILDTVRDRLNTTVMQPISITNFIEGVTHTYESSIRGYCEELANKLSDELGLTHEWDFGQHKWVLHFNDSLFKDVLILPYLSEGGAKKSNIKGDFQYIFELRGDTLNPHIAGQILQFYVSLLVIGYNKKHGMNSLNKVDRTLGRAIVLDSPAKRRYKDEVRDIVETVMDEQRTYIKTDYTFSNTSTSVYLRIKFKVYKDLYVNLRDHGQPTEDKYKVIHINQNNLEESITADLKNILKQHLKESNKIFN